jgi:raffinose/stachyose/melibiose transport system substrate-binding protein
MQSNKYSRRRVVTTAAAVAAGSMLGHGLSAGAAPVGSAGRSVRAFQDYQGEVVIVSIQEAAKAQPTIDAIQAAYPGVKITWRYLPSERFAELFTASEVAGDQIDIMDLNGQDLRRYALGDRMKDLSGITFKDRFREVATATYTIGDKLWALPRGGISGFTFFYNKKSLEKIGASAVPETYADLVAIAPDLKAADIAPFVHAGKNIYLWPVWQFWAYGQTSGNKAVEGTSSVLAGEAKFTDPEHVAALQILANFANDGLFIDGVNSLDSDAAWLQFTQGKALFFYTHSSVIGTYRAGDFPDLDMSLIQPVLSVDDTSIARQLPGGTGNALGIYTDIKDERADIAMKIIDVMTTDPVVKAYNDLQGDPVSCNANVVASDDPLATIYSENCSPNQITYLDWFWPPEITRTFQEQQQGIVAGSTSAEDAASAIQDTLDELYADGYTFEQ